MALDELAAARGFVLPEGRAARAVAAGLLPAPSGVWTTKDTAAPTRARSSRAAGSAT